MADIVGSEYGSQLIPITRNDGTVVWAGVPSDVSLEKNAERGETLSRFPLGFRLGVIYDAFKRGGPMDYKRATGEPDSSLRHFSNYNFGVFAASAGIPRELAIAGAGIHNRFGGGPDTSGPWGMNPQDHQFVLAGYNDYLAGTIKKPPGLLSEFPPNSMNRE